MKNEIWIEEQEKVTLQNPIAVVGSPGLGSIGKLVVDKLIEETRAELIVKLYSTHLPIKYHTKPAYLAHYALPGVGGIKVEKREIDLPKVEFFINKPSLILANGYHANFEGAYVVANKVVEILKELGTKRIIIAAGFGSKEKKVCCAGTSLELIQEMKKNYNLETEYQGPFYGFSGLVFGAAKLKGVDAISLFAGVEPKPGIPEFPAKDSSKVLTDVLKKMIGII
jgi:proteasome assembly chaperone (PAC2) family protein